jgi:hypothetical protein
MVLDNSCPVAVPSGGCRVRGSTFVGGPTPAQVEHYMRMFESLSGEEWCIGESLGWTVIRPDRGRLTVDEVVRRLRGDPDAMTTCRPADIRFEDDLVYLEQRGDAVMILEYAANTVDPGVRNRLSQKATVHGVYWAINNANGLFYGVDGVVVTEFDTLRPGYRCGTDPEALTDHLDKLLDLHDLSRPAIDRSADRDWPTAMATLESLTGLRLDADWFRRPQLCAVINSR